MKLCENFAVMPYVKVMIHFVWSTKNREPFLSTPELRKKVWKHIKDNAVGKGIFIDMIDGYQEHCHCLISLGIDQSISRIMQLLKGESSFWINKNRLGGEKFEWQDEYFATAVSETLVPRVREYIKNQEDHHQTKTFAEEYDLLIKKLDF
jgi:putative transposase